MFIWDAVGPRNNELTHWGRDKKDLHFTDYIYELIFCIEICSQQSD